MRSEEDELHVLAQPPEFDDDKDEATSTDQPQSTDNESKTENINRGDGVESDGDRSYEDMQLEMQRSNDHSPIVRTRLNQFFGSISEGSMDVELMNLETLTQAAGFSDGDFDDDELEAVAEAMRKIDVTGVDWFAYASSGALCRVAQRVRECRTDGPTEISIRCHSAGRRQNGQSRSEKQKLIDAHESKWYDAIDYYVFHFHEPENSVDEVAEPVYTCIIDGEQLARLYARNNLATQGPYKNYDATGTSDGTKFETIPWSEIEKFGMIVDEWGSRPTSAFEEGDFE